MPESESRPPARPVQRRLEWFALTGFFGAVLQSLVRRANRRANRRDDPAPPAGPGKP